MGRRNESVLEDIIRCNWWVGCIVAAGVFFFMRYLIPYFLLGDGNDAMTQAIYQGFAKGSYSMAPVVAIIFLIGALLSFLSKR